MCMNFFGIGKKDKLPAPDQYIKESSQRKDRDLDEGEMTRINLNQFG